MAIQKLNCTKIVEIKENDGRDKLSSLGNNLFAVVGNSKRMQGDYEYSLKQTSVVDIEKGETLWAVDLCYGNKPIADDKAVYIGRELKARRYMTAHNRVTGEEIWECSLSSSSNQFCTPLVQNDKYIFHSNSKTIFVVDKEKGKVANKIKLQHQYAERIVVIP